MKNKSFLQIVFEVIFIFLLTTLGLGLLGYLIDKKLNSFPLFILIFSIVGIIVSLYLLFIYNKNI
ncbi:MAG: AtpZ/AtpI family protein [Caldisericia bacterium]|nr:AtpZ/AtpI family protein [Caldisericia bacterium]